MFCLIGFVVSFLVVIKILFYLNTVLTRKRFVWLQNDDLWAVVTGGAQGIGFEFARQLAHKGYNLMLISLYQDELDETVNCITESVASENNGECRIKFRTLVVDYRHLDIYQKIENFLQPSQNDIFILVNNVGSAPDKPGYFTEESSQSHLDLIKVNVVSTVKMTELVLPSMVEKRRGLIVNISSASSHFPVPMLTTYGSTKAFITHFSRCLAEEYRKHNVLIHNLSPNFVSTKLTYHAKPNLLVASANSVVSSLLSSLHYTDNIESDGYWSHRIVRWIIQALITLTSRQHISYLFHYVGFQGGELQKKYLRSLREKKLTRDQKPMHMSLGIFFKAAWKAFNRER